jgi:hypothetical protein
VKNEFVWDPACGDGCIIDVCRKFGAINTFGADLYVPSETMVAQMKQFLNKVLEVKTKSAILMSSSTIYTQYFKDFIAVQKDICLLHVCEKYNFINEEGAAVDIGHVVLIIVGYGFPKLSANIVHIIIIKLN